MLKKIKNALISVSDKSDLEKELESHRAQNDSDYLDLLIKKLANLLIFKKLQ